MSPVTRSEPLRTTFKAWEFESKVRIVPPVKSLDVILTYGKASNGEKRRRGRWESRLFSTESFEVLEFLLVRIPVFLAILRQGTRKRGAHDEFENPYGGSHGVDA